MPRTDEAEHWFNAVYAAVQEIPAGKVTSYGHIALLLGERMSPSKPLSFPFQVDSLESHLVSIHSAQNITDTNDKK